MAEDPIEMTFQEPETEDAPQDEEAKKEKITLDMEDHFTLPHPASYIKFQNKDLQIFSLETSQIVIEKKGDEIIGRKTKEGSIGLLLLRGFYALMAFLLSGFIFIFCIQILLFLFIGLITESGSTGTNTETFQGGPFISTFLSLPVFIYGLSNFMATATAFTSDIGRGSNFIRSVANLNEDNVFFDWATFVFFMLVPFVVGCGTLYSKQDDWWEITASTWLICIFSYYLIFVILILFYEVRGCLILTSTHPKLRKEFDDSGDENETSQGDKIYSFRNIKRAVEIRLKQKYSAIKVEETIHEDKDDDDDGIIDASNNVQSIYNGVSNIAKKLPWCFETLEEPKLFKTFDEIKEDAPFETTESWSLEKLFFIARSKQVIGITHGISKLTKSQILSTLLCAIIGSLIPILLLGGLMTWFDIPPFVTAVVVVVMIISTILSLSKSANFYELYKREMETKPVYSMYREKKNYIIAEPKPVYYWTLFVIEQILFFLVPMIGLYTTKNTSIASLFLAVALITYVRYYCNASSSILEIGGLEGMPDNDENEYELWLKRHRMNMIIGKVSRGRRRNFWIVVFSFLVFSFLSLSLLAVAVGVSEGSETTLKQALNFKYEQNEYMSYPTCRMGADNRRPAGSETALLDFIFLSSLAYSGPEVRQDMLNEWFGESYGIDQFDTITDSFKADYEAKNGKTAVRYQLIDFPQNDVSIVAIRGTANGWDAIADAQLWMAAILVQYTRALLPLGEIWNPILRHIVTLVSIIESDSIKNVAYYKETTQFTEYVKERRNNTMVTGHSLGGGLALISGGQAKVPAIAISGPNNMLGRNTYEPKLTVDDINKYMFNVVPDRDPVPTFDDKGRLYQRIACNAATNNFASCHFIARTLCEVMTKCGSHNRPALCICTQSYGYPEPTRIGGNMTFAEACAD